MLRDLSPKGLRTALDGRGDVATLVEQLLPLIQVRVARVLRRLGERRAHAGIRNDVEDQVQDVLMVLFRDNGRVLRRWQPGRGLSLANYVGLVTERRVISTLRSGKKTWREDIVPSDDLDRAAPGPDAERRTASRDTLDRLLASLQAELSVYGWQMFHLLFIEERPIEEVSRVTASSPDAIYAWRSRLRRRARKLFRSLETESGPSRRIPKTKTRGGLADRRTPSSIRRGAP